MIVLRDCVLVPAPPEVVWDWLEHLPDHYLEWHPDHRSARWVGAGGLAPGAVLEVREVLHGSPHRLRMRLVAVEPGRRLRYRIAPGLGGAFEVTEVAGGSRFCADISLGVPGQRVGPVVDRVLRRVLGDRIDAMARHQAEEGTNLRRLLTPGVAVGLSGA